MESYCKGLSDPAIKTVFYLLVRDPETFEVDCIGLDVKYHIYIAQSFMTRLFPSIQFFSSTFNHDLAVAQLQAAES
jgi:hypothetical protein